MVRFPRRASSLLIVVFLAFPAATTGRGSADSSVSAGQALSGLPDLLKAGKDAVLTGRPNDALSIFKQALTLAETAGDESSLAQALEGYGWGEWATGRYTEALLTRTRALELFTKLDDAPRQARLRRALGETYFSLSRYEEALAQYQLALEANGRAPVPLEHGLILANMGSALRSLGRLAEAHHVLEKAEAVLRPTGDHGAISQVLTFLGIVSRATGAYDKALQYYAEAIVERRAANDRRGEAQVLGNLANVHLDIGEYDRAIELNGQSLAIATEVGYTAQVGFAHGNTGAAQSHLGLSREALASYDKALAVWRQIGRRAQLGWTLHNAGILRLYQTGEVARALQHLEESLQIAQEVRDPELESYALRGLANLAVVRKDYALAMDRFARALPLAQGTSPQVEYLVLLDRAEALRLQGKSEEAVADLQAAVVIVNDLRANVGSDQSKIAFMDSVQEVFYALADILFDLGRVEEALEIAEASRARAFADLLMQREVRGRAPVPPSVAALRSAVAHSAGKRLESARAGNDSLATALERVRAESPQLASAVSAESPRVADMRRVSARLDATVVEYLVTTRRVTAWVVSPSGTIRSVALPIRAQDLKSLGDVRSSIEGTYRLADSEQTRRQLRSLYKALIRPIAKWLPSSADRRVVIVPHGPLALVPFAALEDGAGVPLIERHTLLYVPSLGVSPYLSRVRSDNAEDALIVADPPAPAATKLPRLPASRQEAQRIAAHLSGLNALILSGPAATEAAVKRKSAAARILHFATHGLVSETAPLTSSVVLAAGDGEDGFLRVDEVLWMNLETDLVVLSGCSTGAGKLSGDGILGLTRAFLFAGTPSLIVTQWDIADDPTMVLMDRFYAELGKGEDKARALRQAQLATRKRFPHPAYWASFILIGEP